MILTRKTDELMSSKESQRAEDQNRKQLQVMRRSLRADIDEVMKENYVVLSSGFPKTVKLKESLLHLELMRKHFKRTDHQIHYAINNNDRDTDAETCENFDCNVLG